MAQRLYKIRDLSPLVLDDLEARLAGYYAAIGDTMAEYHSVTESTQDRWQPGSGPLYKKILPYARPGFRVLEVGCGPALGARYFLEIGCQFTGIDFNPMALEKARQRTPNGTFAQQTSRGLPFGDDIFDLVYSTFVIEHLPRPNVMLDEMARVCADEGCVIVVAPDWICKGEGRFSSLKNGLSHRPLVSKIRSFAVLDTLSHIYFAFLWWPHFVRRARAEIMAADPLPFYINPNPVCFETEWFADADAVYVANATEVAAYLKRCGFQILESGLLEPEIKQANTFVVIGRKRKTVNEQTV